MAHNPGDLPKEDPPGSGNWVWADGTPVTPEEQQDLRDQAEGKPPRDNSSVNTSVTGTTDIANVTQPTSGLPGADLDTEQADVQRKNMQDIINGLQQQATTGNGAWQQSFVKAVQDAKARASGLGQSQAMQSKVGGAGAARNIANAQGAVGQRAANAETILRNQAKLDAENQLATLENAQGQGDIAQSTSQAAARQAARMADVALQEEAHKNTQATISAAAQAIPYVGSAVGDIAKNASKGGKVDGKARVHGDDEANDIVPAMLSPGEIVIPRSIALSADAAEKSKHFVEAVKRKHGAKHLAGGGWTGSGNTYAWKPGTNDPSATQSVNWAGAMTEIPTTDNGGLLDTTAYEQTRKQMDELEGMQRTRAGGGNSIADVMASQQADEEANQAIRAQIQKRAVAGDVLQSQAESGAKTAGAAGAKRGQEQSAGQQALGNSAQIRRAQELQLAQNQQQAEWANTASNLGISLANQAALRNILSAAGQGVVGLSQMAARNAERNKSAYTSPSDSDTPMREGESYDYNANLEPQLESDIPDVAPSDAGAGDVPVDLDAPSYAAHGGEIHSRKILTMLAGGGDVPKKRLIARGPNGEKLESNQDVNDRIAADIAREDEKRRQYEEEDSVYDPKLAAFRKAVRAQQLAAKEEADQGYSAKAARFVDALKRQAQAAAAAFNPSAAAASLPAVVTPVVQKAQPVVVQQPAAQPVAVKPLTLPPIQVELTKPVGKKRAPVVDIGSSRDEDDDLSDLEIQRAKGGEIPHYDEGGGVSAAEAPNAIQMSDAGVEVPVEKPVLQSLPRSNPDAGAQSVLIPASMPKTYSGLPTRTPNGAIVPEEKTLEYQAANQKPALPAVQAPAVATPVTPAVVAPARAAVAAPVLTEADKLRAKYGPEDPWTREQRAIEAQGQLQAQAAADQAKAQLAYAKTLETGLVQQQRKQKLYEEAGAARMAQYDAALSALKNIDTNVDPNRYFASQSTPQKILGIIGLALGTFGSRDGTNQAAIMMGKAIDRDIDAQKADIMARLRKGEMNLAAAQNAYGMHRAIFQDDLAATAATKATMLDLADLQQKQIATSYASPMAQAQSQQLSAQLQKAKDTYLRQAQHLATEDAKLRAETAREYAQVGKLRGAGGPSYVSPEFVSTGAIKLSPDELKDFRTGVSNGSVVKKQAQELSGLISNSTQLQVGGNAARAAAIAAQLKSNLKEMEKLGALSGSDYKLLDDQVPDPSAIFTMDSTKLARLKQLSTELDNRVAAQAKTLGLVRVGRPELSQEQLEE